MPAATAAKRRRVSATKKRVCTGGGAGAAGAPSTETAEAGCCFAATGDAAVSRPQSARSRRAGAAATGIVGAGADGSGGRFCASVREARRNKSSTCASRAVARPPLVVSSRAAFWASPRAAASAPLPFLSMTNDAPAKPAALDVG